MELDSSYLSQHETIPVFKTNSVENTGISSMMQNIITQSLTARSQNPTTELANEVLGQ